MGRLFDRRSMQRRCRRGQIDELELEPVVASLRVALMEAPDRVVEARHLAAMRAAVASEVPTARRHVTSEPRRGAARRYGPRRTRAVWATVLTTVGVAVPSIAVAGALPGPAQHAASRAAAIVHLHVPDTAPKKPAQPPAARPETTVAVAHTPAPVATTAAPAVHHSSASPAPTQPAGGTQAPTSPPTTTKHDPIANPPVLQNPKQPSPPPTHKKNGHAHNPRPPHHKKRGPNPKRHHGKKPPKGSKPPFGPI